MNKDNGRNHLDTRGKGENTVLILGEDDVGSFGAQMRNFFDGGVYGHSPTPPVGASQTRIIPLKMVSTLGREVERNQVASESN